MRPKPSIHEVEILPRQAPNFWHEDTQHVLNPDKDRWMLYASYQKGHLSPVATIGQRGSGWYAIPANGGQVEVIFDDWRAAVLHAIANF